MVRQLKLAPCSDLSKVISCSSVPAGQARMPQLMHAWQPQPAGGACRSHLLRSPRSHAALGVQRLLNAATLEGAPLHRSALAWRAIVQFERCRGPRGMAAGAAMRALQFVPWNKVGAVLVISGLAG